MSLAVLPSITGGTDDRTAFEISTDVHDDTTCSGPHCEADYTQKPDQYAETDYSYAVECTMAGMAADYGSVEFCSTDCAREFAALDAVRPDYQEMAGREEGVTHDLIIYPGDPWHAAVVDDYGFLMFHAFAHSKARAITKCDDWIRATPRANGDPNEFSRPVRPLESSTADDLLVRGTEDQHINDE